MALVSLWTIFFLDVEALSLVGVAAGVILLTQLWPDLSGRVPALIWKLAVPAIVVTAAADFYFSPDTLPVLIRLAILLVLYRTTSYRRKREDLQLIVLGLFLIVAAGVLTVSLGFGFLLLLFTACALGFLFTINLIDASETGGSRTPGAETAWTRLGWRRFLGRLRQVADWRLIGFAGGLFLTVVVMSGLLFVVIPRFEVASGFFLDKYITRKSHTGFTDTIRFGEVGELIRDESVAMRVDVTDASTVGAIPYWRMVALDEYTPQGFRVSAHLKGQLIRSQRVGQVLRGRAGPVNRPGTVGGTWTVYIEPGVSRFLALPGSFGSLRLRDAAIVQTTFNQKRRSQATADAGVEGVHLVALRLDAMAMTAYQLEGVELAPAIADPDFPRILRGWRQGGEGVRDDRNYDPRILLEGPSGAANAAALKAMVREITGGATLAAPDFVRQASSWLQAHHAYTLGVKLPPGEGRDDIVRWLGSNEPGFCEYFAAGFAVLARAAGFPTRVIAGFHGGVLNGFENYYMVRNSDAHAWAEIFDGTGAWLRVDPTPGTVTATVENTAVAARQARDSSWSARVDSLRVLWYRRIVSFDSRTQVQLMEQVKTLTADSGQALRSQLEDYSRRLKSWLVRPWDGARLARTLGAGAVGLALAWSAWRLGRLARTRWLGWRRPEALDPVRQEAGRWLGRLGHGSSGKVVPGEVLAELRRLRYGRRETWPNPHQVFKRARRVRKLDLR